MPPMDLLTPKMWTPLYYENGFCIGRTHLLLWKKVLMRHRWAESPSSLQLPARMDDPQGTWKRLCHFSPGKTNKKKTSLTHISWDILKTKKCGKNITPGPTALHHQRRTLCDISIKGKPGDYDFAFFVFKWLGFREKKSLDEKVILYHVGSFQFTT